MCGLARPSSSCSSRSSRGSSLSGQRVVIAPGLARSSLVVTSGTDDTGSRDGDYSHLQILQLRSGRAWHMAWCRTHPGCFQTDRRTDNKTWRTQPNNLTTEMEFLCRSDSTQLTSLYLLLLLPRGGGTSKHAPCEELRLGHAILLVSLCACVSLPLCVYASVCLCVCAAAFTCVCCAGWVTVCYQLLWFRAPPRLAPPRHGVPWNIVCSVWVLLM